MRLLLMLAQTEVVSVVPVPDCTKMPFCAEAVGSARSLLKILARTVELPEPALTVMPRLVIWRIVLPLTVVWCVPPVPVLMMLIASQATVQVEFGTPVEPSTLFVTEPVALPVPLFCTVMGEETLKEL